MYWRRVVIILKKMRSLVHVFIFTFALLCLSCGTSYAAQLSSPGVNPVFKAWQEKAAPKVFSLTNSAKTENYGYVPSPINWSHLENMKQPYGVNGTMSSLTMARNAAALPVSYDLRDNMPSVRNQNPFGNCWTHAAMAATESNLITKKLVTSTDIYLSEWYITYFACNSDRLWSFTNRSEEPYYEMGGNDWMAVALLSRGTGSVLDADSHTPTSIESIYDPMQIDRKYKIKNALYLGNLGKIEISIPLAEQRAALLKEAIMTHGSLSVGINFEDSAYDKTKYAFFSDKPYDGTNHAVTVVGWDDNYDFATASLDKKPQGKGAWIVRNSWGDGWGDKGYFYVSYEEQSLCDGVVYDTEIAPQGEKIYQYDPLGNTGFLAYDEHGIYDEPKDGGSVAGFANVFTAGGNELIESVSFYTAAPDQKCEIKIYVGCNSSPTSGYLALSQNVTVAAPGYNTVDLTNAVKVAKGQKFSVVVTTSSDITKYLIPAEFRSKNYTESAFSEAGQSWVSNDGIKFEDILKVQDAEKFSYANVCIKAFAVDDPNPAESGGGCSAGAYGAFALLAVLPIISMFRRRQKR